MSLPHAFPPLPEPPSGQWSPNIRTAHATLASIYKNTLNVLNQEDTDPLRLAFHIDSISFDGLSLLEALEMEGRNEGDSQPVPEDWLHLCASVLGDLVANFHQVKEAAGGQYVLFFNIDYH